MTVVYICLFILSSVIFVMMLFNLHVKRGWHARFFVREELTFGEIYEQAFKDKGISKEDAEKLWNEAASGFLVPPGKLRPTDGFVMELNPYSEYHKFWGLWDESLYRKLEDNLWNKGMEVAGIETLSDYVIAVARANQSK